VTANAIRREEKNRVFCWLWRICQRRFDVTLHFISALPKITLNGEFIPAAALQKGYNFRYLARTYRDADLAAHLIYRVADTGIKGYQELRILGL
jgi:hypothetical protein